MKNGKYTNEELKVIIHCRRDEQTVRLATDLLETRETNPGVWDHAPDNAGAASINFSPKVGSDVVLLNIVHFRDLPKTRARKIAERYSCDSENCHHMIEGKRAVDVIESAINEALKDN
jgi:hypothetical protein